jgi:hypothetical protein
MGYAYRVIHNPRPMAEIECAAQNRGLDFRDGLATMGIAHLGECSKEVLDERRNGSVREVQRSSVL